VKKKFLDQIREKMEIRNYGSSTIESYLYWIKRFIIFNQKKHPKEMGEKEVEIFLENLALREKVSASTQNQAFSALIYLYKNFLNTDFKNINSFRARAPKTLPVVFSKKEIKNMLQHLEGIHLLMIKLLYGCGLRINELITLRVKDFDLEKRLLHIHRSKGQKDRIVPLPENIIIDLQNHKSKLKTLYIEDQKLQIFIPSPTQSLKRKYPSIETNFIWMFFFPSKISSPEINSGKLYRWHTDGTSLQRSLRKAISLAKIEKHGSCHTLRHSFATHLIESGTSVKVVQELLGHKDIRTTMVYTQISSEKILATISPLENLLRNNEKKIFNEKEKTTKIKSPNKPTLIKFSILGKILKISDIFRN